MLDALLLRVEALEALAAIVLRVVGAELATRWDTNDYRLIDNDRRPSNDLRARTTHITTIVTTNSSWTATNTTVMPNSYDHNGLLRKTYYHSFNSQLS